MHKKSFTFGAGIAILLMTLVFYFVYNNQTDKYKAAYQTDIDALQAEITDLTSIIAEKEPETQEVVKWVELTDEEIEDRARLLGMDYVEADEPNQPAEPEEAPPVASPRPTPSVLADEEDYVTIRITSGSSSSEISNLLQKSGLIESAREFNQFIAEANYSKKLAYGTFKIMKGSSFEEILAIIGR